MKVVVLFESRTGNTREAARWVGGAAEAAGADVSVRSIREPDLDEISAADLVFVGTWVDGLVLFGHRPGSVGQLKRHLPALWGKNVAAFCTHAVNPGNAADKLGGFLERRGGTVVAARSFHRRRLPGEIPTFVEEAMAAVSPTTAPAG
jgi:flavodoxin